MSLTYVSLLPAASANQPSSLLDTGVAQTSVSLHVSANAAAFSVQLQADNATAADATWVNAGSAVTVAGTTTIVVSPPARYFRVVLSGYTAPGTVAVALGYTAAVNDSTKLATTAYTDSAVATETTRAAAAEALALPKTGGTMSGPIAMGASKVTGLANGSAGTDAAAFGQIPAALPPNGAAGGALTGTYPNPGLATVTIAGGGTGQTTQQAAIDALAGAQSAGKVLRSDGTHTTLAAIQAGDVPTLNQYARVFSPLAYGAAGDGTTDDSTAMQAAFAAAAAAHGILDLGNYQFKTTAPILLASGITVRGNTVMGSSSSKGAITNTATDVFQFGAGGTSGNVSNVTFKDLSITGAGGHIFNMGPAGSLSLSVFTGCQFTQNGTGFAILYCPTNATVLENYFGPGTAMTMRAAATVPAINLVTSSSAINGNIFHGVRFAGLGNTTTVPFVHVEMTAAGGYCSGNAFREITCEQLDAGILALYGCSYTVIDNVFNYDTTTYTGSLFVLDKTTGSATIQTTIRNSGSIGGAVTGSVYHVKGTTSGCGQLLLENVGGESGTANLSVPPLVTTIINPVGAAGITTPAGSIGGYPVNGTSVALADASTITVDASKGKMFRVTLGSVVGATRLLGNPTNPADGQSILIEIIQDGSGSRALTYDTAYTFGIGLPAPTLTTTAGLRDFIGFVYNSTAAKWYCVGFLNGF